WPCCRRSLSAAPAATLARRGALLDARARERYRGEREPIDPVAGHIPGSLSAPTTANIGPDGRFLPAAGLRARFATLGAAAGAGLVGTYCGSGVTAAHEVLALELAGIPASLYVGSWSDWVADPARPVAPRPAPGEAGAGQGPTADRAASRSSRLAVSPVPGPSDWRGKAGDGR